MTPIDIRLLRAAALYAQVGMGLGLYMGVSGDHSLFPAHAHINVLGWVTLALYGIVYRIYPEAADSRLAPWHFWLANTGALLLVIGITGIVSGHEQFAPVAGAGAVVSLLGGAVFARILFSRSVRPGTAAEPLRS